MDPKAAAASAILRRFAVALKTYGLYPPPSPVTDRAIGEVLGGLHQYVEAHGPFAVRVSRRSFHVNEATFQDATSANFASHLYIRKVIGFAVMPGITARDLTAFLGVVRQDRTSLEEAGGISKRVLQEGVQGVRVTQIVLSPGAASRDQHLDVLWDLIGDGRNLSAENQEIVADILRSGPAAIGGMFDQLHALLANAVEDRNLTDWAQTTYDVIKNLDQIILNHPIADQQQFYNNLATAILLLEDPIRMPLEHTLAAHEQTDETARFLLDRLSEQRLVKVVPRSTLEDGDTAAQRALAAEPPEDQPALDPEMQILHAQWTEGVRPTALAIRGEAHGEPPEDLLTETKATDDVAVTREAIGTLVDVLRSQDDESELMATTRVLEEYLPWLVEHREFPLMRMVLQGLKDAAPRSSAVDRAVADTTDDLLSSRLLRAMLDILWEGRGTGVEDDIRTCLELLADRVVFPLMGILGEEERAERRRMLCDIIVAIGRDRIDDVGRSVSDARWYLVRNVAYILGRLGDPRGVAYVAGLAKHREYRVRCEAVAALARIGSQDAEDHLTSLLDDPDDRIRTKAILSLSDAGVFPALPKLLRLLEQPDLLQRHFPLKKEIIAALSRARVLDALPVLAHFARRRFVLGRRSRMLRDLAQEAAATLQSSGPFHEPSRATVRMEAGRT